MGCITRESTSARRWPSPCWTCSCRDTVRTRNWDVASRAWSTYAAHLDHPTVDPDGLEWDLSGGPRSAAGARTGSPRPEAPASAPISIGIEAIDGAAAAGRCGASSSNPASDLVRGRARWSAPEVRAVRDHMLRRVLDSREHIRANVSFHTAGEMRAMAGKNGYPAQQWSAIRGVAPPAVALPTRQDHRPGYTPQPRGPAAALGACRLPLPGPVARRPGALVEAPVDQVRVTLE